MIRKPRVSEATIQREIMRALALKGCWVLRLNSGATVIGSGKVRRLIRGCEAGTPDLLVIAPVTGFLEVKSPTGRRTKSQIAWHANAAQHGVRVEVVRSVSDALDAVDRWHTEERQ